MKYLFVVIIVLITGKLTAQSTQSWFSITMPFKKNNWEWHNDAGYRNELTSFTTQQFFFRTGARHYFNNNVSGAIGYAFFDTKVQGVESNEFGLENRIWQEVNGVFSLNKHNAIVHRVRTEERWFSKTSIDEAFFAFRSRYRIAFQHQISKIIDIHLYNELMYQLRKDQLNFNQYRVGLNFLVKLSSSAQMNLGYTRMSTSQGAFNLFLFGFTKR